MVISHYSPRDVKEVELTGYRESVSIRLNLGAIRVIAGSGSREKARFNSRRSLGQRLRAYVD